MITDEYGGKDGALCRAPQRPRSTVRHFARPHTGPRFAAGPERQLFRKAFAEDAMMGVAGYDVAPDGRFLLVIPEESESIRPDMHVLLNVDDELRRRIP